MWTDGHDLAGAFGISPNDPRVADLPHTFYESFYTTPTSHSRVHDTELSYLTARRNLNPTLHDIADSRDPRHTREFNPPYVHGSHPQQHDNQHVLTPQSSFYATRSPFY